MKVPVLTLGAVVPRPPLCLTSLPAHSGVGNGPPPVAFRKSHRNLGPDVLGANFCCGPLGGLMCVVLTRRWVSFGLAMALGGWCVLAAASEVQRLIDYHT